MKSVTIDTVQGIGDLMWVYRKLAPLYDRINFNVLKVNDTMVQRRGEPFLRTLDKCGGVTYKMVSSADYNVLAKEPCVIKPDYTQYRYAINAWLESGVHLDDIDKNPVLWNLNLGSKRIGNLPKDYLLVYISGNKGTTGCGTQMDDKDWAELIDLVARKKDIKNILFTGAPYDEEKMWKVMQLVREKKFNCHMLLMPIREAMFLIQSAKYFISYQSGLCMLAEEFGTPTLMVWFSFLKAMKNTWIRKENIEKGLIEHCYFDQSPNEMFWQIK